MTTPNISVAMPDGFKPYLDASAQEILEAKAITVFPNGDVARARQWAQQLSEQTPLKGMQERYNADGLYFVLSARKTITEEEFQAKLDATRQASS